jgi:hypothetical protein
MLGAVAWRAVAIGAAVAFLILGGIASRELELLALLVAGVGLIVWVHIPAIDALLLEFSARTWHT